MKCGFRIADCGIGVLLFGALACAGRTGRPIPISAAAATDAVTIRALVTAALEADAQGRGADSLYTSDASVVANGRPRINPPRLAGVGPVGGRILISSLESRGGQGTAWARVEYRWIYGDGNLNEVGAATFILQKRPEGWRIQHVHSSQMMPWDRPRPARPAPPTTPTPPGP